MDNVLAWDLVVWLLELERGLLSQRWRYCKNFEATALKICPFAYNWSAFQQFRRCLARGFALGPK